MRPSHFTSNASILGFIGAELHLSQGACASATLGAETDPEALLALIGIGLRAPPPPDLEPVLRKALADRARGDTAMANIRLAYIPLPATPPDTARRIGLARRLLADGFAPYDLLEALDLDPTTYGLRKYDPDQPRVPSGQPEGGRWTSGAEAGGAAQPSGHATLATAGATTVPVEGDAASGLFDSFGEEALPTLLRLATRFAGPLALLGAIIIPSPGDGGVKSGVAPGALGVHYNLDGASGRLTLSIAGADGQPVTIVTGNKHGAYVDADGRKVGVALGGGFALDEKALAAALKAQASMTGRPLPRTLLGFDDAGAIVSERRTARSPGGGAGSPRARCLRAADGTPDDWEDFCNSIPPKERNNVVGEGPANLACKSKRFSSPTEKRNWCLNQYGTK